MSEVYQIAVLPGDGVGREVMREAIKALSAVQKKFGLVLETREFPIGQSAYEKYGNYFPQETANGCAESGAILFGATGASESRGREVILDLRKLFCFFCNIRPAVAHVNKNKFDFVIIRELSGGIYFGRQDEAEYKGLNYDTIASETSEYSVFQIARVSRIAFQIARDRKKHVISVDKANVLATSRLWRKVVEDVAKEFPDVFLRHMLADAAAYTLAKAPDRFDVILTDNLFGDILSDEAAGMVGSLGLMPSASLNENGFGLYEPVHGSAPDIAGKNVANPIGMILSAAMCLRYSFKLMSAAECIEQAVWHVISEGYGTRDTDPVNELSTFEIGDLIANRILSL